MTMPTEEPGFLLRMIFEKVDGIDKKVDGQAEKLAAHEVRLSALEASKKDRRATWVAIGIAALAWVPDVLQLIGK